MNYLPYKHNNRWGLINPKNMQIIIEPKYQSLFANGDYPKNFYKVIEDDDYGIKEFYFINNNDKIVSDRVEIEKYSVEPRCIPNVTNRENVLFSISVNEKSVFYDSNGVKVFGTEFDYVYENSIFFDRLHTVKVDGKYGVIDKKGDIIIKPIYTFLLIHWDKEYIILKKDDKALLYRIKDSVYIDFDCEDIYIAKELIFIKRAKYAIFTKEFKKQSDFIYEKLSTNDRYIVAKKDSKVGMMDIAFNIIIPFIYESLGFLYWGDAKEYEYFRDARFIAELDNAWLVIDEKSNIIFSSKVNYENSKSTSDFSWKYIPSLDGYIENFDHKIVFYSHNKTKEYFIENTLIVTSFADENGLVVFYTQNDKMGFINLKTDYISESIYSQVSIEGKDKLIVCVDDKWGLVDSAGNYILKPKYIDTTSNCQSRIEKSIFNLQKYNLDFLDECESYSVNNGCIATFMKDRTEYKSMKVLKRYRYAN